MLLPQRRGLTLAAALLVALSTWGVVVSAQWATADRLKERGWWPTKGTARRSDFVGADACRECHAAQSATQPGTQMARTAMPAADSPLIQPTHPLSFDSGGYHYTIGQSDGKTVYTVVGGGDSSSRALTWAFGAGDIGQSFLTRDDNGFTEARVSYYKSLGGLAFTPGRAVAAPNDIRQAMGRPIDSVEIRRCFSCHTTAPVVETQFDPANAIPGVTCEACHGPGRQHIAAMRHTGPGLPPTAILNPATLNAAASVDFCGACHATFWDVRLMGETGLPAMRSQPYRLQLSRCWSGGDQRATCVACHDPHKRLETNLGAYDSRCLACHVTAGSTAADHPGRACPVASSNCASCHMPLYDVPEMHQQFRDHFIRVAGGRR